MQDVTVTKRDLDAFGTQLSNAPAQSLRNTVAPKFEAMESRIEALERRYSELSRARVSEQVHSSQPAPSTPPPPGPRPPFHAPMQGSPSKPALASPGRVFGSPQPTGASGRAKSFPPRHSRSGHVHGDDDTHSVPGSLPKHVDPADVLVVGWPEAQTIEEFRSVVARVLPVPAEYEIRTQRLFSNNVIIRCKSVEAAREFIQKVRDTKPVEGGKRLYANKYLSPWLAKQGWQLRQIRKAIIHFTSIDPSRVRICYRSASV
eukprot:1898102-Amphidinium_carterae.1